MRTEQHHMLPIPRALTVLKPQIMKRLKQQCTLHNQQRTSGMHSFTEFQDIFTPRLKMHFFLLNIQSIFQLIINAIFHLFLSLAISTMNGQESARIGFIHALAEGEALKGEAFKLPKWFVDSRVEKSPAVDLTSKLYTQENYGEQGSNKQFQRRKDANLEWYNCGNKGHGLQSLEDISKGCITIGYVGEGLDMCERNRI
ncbi:unnamed protein product [Cuscuta europaea]|uniref:Uncharacterized protein n=1 Tax=Cuscuta europaea TaxID=41803 RepID=A0A9P1ECW3_CUSEU|nr:unnamed protein product [Cuscuta europaea]